MTASSCQGEPFRRTLCLLIGYSLGTYLNEWSREFEGESSARYKVSVVDTWGMTEEELPGTFEGKFRIDLPSKQYMMLRLTKLEA